MDQTANEAHLKEYNIVSGQGALESVPPAEEVTSMHELMIEITRQNETALEQLYDRTTQNVYSLAMRITGETATAEEVVSDVFFQIWNKAENYRADRGSVLAWIMMITRSRSLDAIRKQTRDQVLPLETAEQVPASLDDVEKQLMNMDSCSEIHKALRQIGSTQRQLVALSFFRGYSHQQMSDFTGIPLGTVKSHLKRAMNTMHTLLINSGKMTGEEI